jgi:hypothetical protein
MIRWYRAGQDVQRRLPILSTYLGHSHVGDTYWYLTQCPELMQWACNASGPQMGNAVAYGGALAVPFS